MNKVVYAEILDIAQYERVRNERRSRVIAIKKKRRLAVGPMITLVFENHETVLSQIQEMMRAERLVDEAAIQHEIDTYNEILPEHNELAATMFIELKEPGRIREEITKFHGVNTGEAIYLQVGDERLSAVFIEGQSDDRRISAVQYLRFRFSDAQRDAFVKGREAVKLVVEHPNYQYSAVIDGELREELSGDLVS